MDDYDIYCNDRCLIEDVQRHVMLLQGATAAQIIMQTLILHTCCEACDSLIYAGKASVTYFLCYRKGNKVLRCEAVLLAVMPPSQD